ncbi:MAG: flagellar biosynthetic protein FliO [Bacillota bacterium]|nr:flagellar biosynthetic protein FliO [Bacillota bacterium]
MFLLLLWFVSRYLIKRRGGFPSNSRIRVRERALLHGDTVVALVEVEGKNYIVASNKNSVTLLDVRDDLRSFEDTYSEAKAGIRLEQIGSLFKKKS